jgi:excisionase family DNA binding protein
MIRFKSMDKLAEFLEKNLPEKIKSQLFTETHSWEHKGKMRESQRKLKPVEVMYKLMNQGFLIGINENPDNYPYPEEYILLWSKMLRFIKANDTLSVEQEKYALLSINKACKMLEVTRPTLYKIINEGKIPYVQIFSQKRIQLSDLLAYIENGKIKKEVS